MIKDRNLKNIDDLLEVLPAFDSGDRPDIDTLVKNLNSLEGLFLAEQMKNALDTIWWAEQLLLQRHEIYSQDKS